MDAASYPLYNTKTRQRELLDDDQVTSAVLGGTHSFPEDAQVPVFDPDGRRATIGAGELRAAIKEGFRVIGPRELAIDEYLRDNDNLAGAAKVFFGQALDEFALGVPELIADYSEDPFQAAKREAIKKQNEVASMLGSATGFVGSALFGPAKAVQIGAKALSKAGGKAIAARIAKGAAMEGAEKTAEKAAAGMLSRLGGQTVDGVAEGALLSVPHAITESAFGDHDAAAESLLVGTMAGGLFGAGTGLMREMLDAGKSGASRFYSWAEGKPLTGPEVAKKVGRTVTGVPENNIGYLAEEENLARMIQRNPDGSYTPIVPERDAIRDEAETVLNTIKDNYDKAQQSYTQILSDTNTAFRRELDDISKGSAPEPVIAQIQDYLERMKSTGGDVRIQYDNTLKGIQDAVMAAGDPETINRIPFMVPRGSIDNMLKRLEEGLGSESAILGKKAGLTADPGKLAALNKLKDVRYLTEEYFRQVDEMFGPEVLKGMDMLFARNIVRDLDAIADYGLNAGQFDSAVSKTIKGAQHDLRQSIRQNLGLLQNKKGLRELDPMTGETVKQLAKQAETLWDAQIRNADTLSAAGQYFQNPIRTANALNSMAGKSFRGSEIARALEAVEKETGESILPMLDEWMQRKDLLRESKLGGDRLEYVRGTLFPDQEAVLQKAKQRLSDAEAEMADFKGWDARRLENAINKIDYKNASIKDQRALDRLSQLRDKYFATPDNPGYTSRNFGQEAKDRAIWDSFDEARVNGSRKAVMGGSIGAAIGSLGGTTGAVLGQALGTGAGGVVDYYGGKMLRDFIINGNNYRGLLFVENAMKKAAKKLDGISSAVDSFGQRKGETVKRLARMGGIQAVLGIKGDFRERRDHWETIQDRVLELAGNPEMLMQRASELSGALSGNGAPRIGAKLNERIMKSVKYIFDEMPKPPRAPTPFSPKVQWKPTDYELKMFDDKLEVLANPFTVIDRMKDRTISSGHVESLKANYPRIYEEIKTRTSETMIEKGTTVDRADRVKLSLLFDESFDSGLSDEGILASQAVYQKDDEEQQGQDGSGGQPMDVQIAGQYMSARVGRGVREMQPS